MRLKRRTAACIISHYDTHDDTSVFRLCDHLSAPRAALRVGSVRFNFFNPDQKVQLKNRHILANHRLCQFFVSIYLEAIVLNNFRSMFAP